MFRNPIIHKEVLSALRTKKAVALQAGFLLAVTVMVWLLWPAGGLQDLGGQQARRILSILAMGELMIVILVAPAFTAAAVTSEMEHNTLEGLFASRLKPREIVAGKIVGSLTFLVLLTLTGAPALATPFLLGGIGHYEVLTLLGLLLLTAVYLGMIGLFLSTLMHRSYRAIIVTYGVLFLVCIIAPLPAWPVSNHLLARGDPFWQNALHGIASLSPVQAMMSLVWPDSVYVQGARALPPFWQSYLYVGGGMIILMALLCLWRLRRPPQPPRPREKLRVVERNQVSARSLFFLFDPRKRKRPVAWWQNPVLCKEFRTRPMLQVQWLLRSVGVCLVISVLLMFLVSIGVQAFVSEGATSLYQNMATAVAAMMVLLVVLLGPAIAGGAICTDRETGVWDLMRVTPIPSWRIVTGKFQASIIPLVLLILSALPAMFILVYFDASFAPQLGEFIESLRFQSIVPATYLRVLLGGVMLLFVVMFFGVALRKSALVTGPTVIFVLLLSAALAAVYASFLVFSPMLQRVCAVIGITILFTCTAGTMFSSLFSRTSAATAWTYGLVVTLSLLSLLGLLIEDLLSRRVVEAAFLLNPIIAAMEASGAPGVQKYGLLNDHLKVMAVATGAMFVITVLRVFQLRRAN
ncbi:MAG: ABC transporter permease [Phycisphaerae bacterium]|nr:ABC transporter permease [Phycisphaerae bacterium]